MRVFLLAGDYNGERLYQLKNKEKQYLGKVLRLSVGAELTAKDRKENYYKATLVDDDTLSLEKTDNPELTMLDDLSGYKGEFKSISMFISILKGKKNEMVVRALTEMGIKRIFLVKTDFVQEREFSAHQKDRLDTILKEAVQQSGSAAPILIGPISFDEALKEAGNDAIMLHQSRRNKTISLKEAIREDMDEISCFIGPEGGFSDEECEKAEAIGVKTVLLNTNILRAETAAIYSAASIQTLLQG